MAGLTVPGTIVSALVGATLSRTRGSGVLSMLGAGCAAATVAVWWFRNEPVNREVVEWWRADSLPAKWHQRRDQWECAHAASAVLHGIGLTALIAATLGDR